MAMFKTTIEISEDLYMQAKLIALKNRKPVAHLIRKALADKVRQIHEAEQRDKNSK